MFIKGYSDFSIRSAGILKGCEPRLGVYFRLHTNVSELFPYIIAKIKKARQFDRPAHVRFNYKKAACTLYPLEVMAVPFTSRGAAVKFIEDFIAFLNDLHDEKHLLTPNHNISRQMVSVVDILKSLPRTNCEKCGLPTCTAFAAALRVGKTHPEKCPDFPKPVSVKTEYPIVGPDGRLISTFSIETRSVPEKKSSERNGNENREQRQAPETIADAKAPLYDQFGNRIQKGLSKREIQVLRHIVDGSTNSEISNLLNISPHTVKSHVIHIFNKISASDRTQAAVWAVRNGMV